MGESSRHYTKWNKNKYCMIPSIHEVVRMVKFIETENRLMVARGWEEEEGGV